MGSTSTSSVGRGCCAAGATRRQTQASRIRRAAHSGFCYFEFCIFHFLLTQSAFRHPLDEGDVELHLVERQPHDVQVERLRLAIHFILPGADAIALAVQFLARQHPRAAGLDVVDLDPSRRHARQGEGKRRVHHHQEHVVDVVDLRQFLQQLLDIVEQEVGDHRHHRRLAGEAGEGGAEAAGMLQFLEAGFVLIGVEAVHHLSLADARAHRGQVAKPLVKGDQADGILEEDRRHADRRDRARDQRGDLRCRAVPRRRPRRSGSTPSDRR